MYYLGIDAGASSLKLVAVSAEGEVVASARKRHAGDIAAAVTEAFALMKADLADAGAGACQGIAACGSAAQLICRADPRVKFVDDIPALVAGVQELAPSAASIVQIGAHSSEAVVLQPGGAPRYARGKDCAAGSGIFLESQMDRLGLSMDDYSQMVLKATRLPRLSGRCAVFAKTDVIHCQQEGEPIENILLGLCYALVRSFKASVAYEVDLVAPVAFVGGVARNAGVVQAMHDVLKLGEGDLLIDDRLEFASVLGAAFAAREAGFGESIDVEALFACLTADAASESTRLPRLAVLPAVEASGDGGVGVSFGELHPKAADDSPVDVYLGIDVGSTSTDAVLLDMDGNLVDAQYTRTGGDPRRAVSQVLDSVKRRLGNRVRLVASATTGSGRVVAGELIGADLVCNEITAQARAAVAVDSRATSVFEIGGQDSKFVSLEAGRVADFQMNKICAAGTGSFVEEQAVYLGLDLADFGDRALAAKAPIDLGERCTVFVETAVRTALAEGASTDDVAAGLCLSVVRNYLHRVVGSKHVGARVVLQGGVAYNKGIVAAFRALSDAEITVSPWFAVSGAVGAALLARDAARADGVGADASAGGDTAAGAATVSPVCQTKCSDKNEAAVGCGVSLAERRDPLDSPRVFYAKTEELYLKGYDPSIDPAKKTVGIPRCLMLHKLFPMANVFFRELGFNVILSDATDEEAVLLSQSVAAPDVCLPVKLLHGHMEQLVQRGVDYIFVPSMQTIRHVKSPVPHNYACVYLQSGPQIAARALKLEERGVELLSPVFKMDFGQPAMAEAMLSVGAQLGKPGRETALAMLSGSAAVAEFTSGTEKLGDQLLSRLGESDRAFVIITRNYGIADPVLNMGVPDLLLERGQHVLTLSHLHAHDIDLSTDYPDLYWPFAQHILSGARIVARDPRLFAVYLTSHGCGPDSMIAHLFKREMGDKPYLQLEVDEHASAVGVTTRIEAFLDAVSQYSASQHDEAEIGSVEDAPGAEIPERAAEEVGVAAKAVDAIADDGNLVLQCATEGDLAGKALKLPSVGIYGPVVAAWLAGKGYKVEEIPFNEESAALGRAGLMEGEYYTFASFLGVAAASLEASSAVALSDSARVVLLPSSEGGDADGQFARVVSTVLDRAGYSDFRILAPKFEQYPFALTDPKGLFRCLVAADICSAAPVSARAGFVKVAVEAARQGFSDEALLGLADDVCAVNEARAAKRIALVGEWPLVYSDELVAGAWGRVEVSGVRVDRMPLSEALCFLWKDAAVNLAAPAPGKTISVDDVQRMNDFAAWAQDVLSRVSKCLGDASSFDADVQGLRRIADDDIHCLIGGFGRYRYAKTKSVLARGGAVISSSSLYENTGIVVRQLLGPSGRVLNLSFDGALNSSIDERLSAFLHYL